MTDILCIFQASSNDTDRAADLPKTTEAEMPGAQAKAKDAEQSASPPSSESQSWLLRLAKASKSFLSID